MNIASKKNEIIYLMSNSSTDIYSNNTLTHFTNKLAEPIEFPFFQQWAVSCRSISISPHFYRVPRIIYIVCSIIGGGYNQEKLLGSYGYNEPLKKTTRLPQTHQFRNLEYHRINFNRVTDITITLLDQDKKKLTFKSGFPTVLKLHLKKMVKKDFNIVLTKYKSEMTFPSNTASDFRIMLPEPLQLDNTWKLGLSSFTYNHNFAVFGGDKKQTFGIVFYPFKGRLMEELQKTPHSFIMSKIIIDENEMTSHDAVQLKQKIFSAFDEINKQLIELCTTAGAGSIQLKAKFPKKRDNEGKLAVYVKGNVLDKWIMDHGSFSIVAEEKLSNVLGLDIISMKEYLEEGFTEQNSKKLANYGVITRELMGDGMDNTYGFIEINEYNTVVKLPKRMEYFYYTPAYLMIYLDVIEHTMVGNTYTRLLKQIPLKETMSGVTSTEFFHKEYKELLVTSLYSLHFSIRDQGGNILHYKKQDDKKNDYHIVLHFVKGA